MPVSKQVHKQGEQGMKALVAEDDFASRKVMSHILSKYGECDFTVDGRETITAFNMSLETEEPYDLVCLDILMPELDGYEVLKTIRRMETEKNLDKEHQVKVIMTSALSERKNVDKAFELGCDAYAGKPIATEKFEKELCKLGVISEVITAK